MPGETDLTKLLENLTPRLIDGQWCFCCLQVKDIAESPEIISSALMTYKEKEGMSLLLPIDVAKEKGYTFDGIFKGITLDVHSSLEAVGLTAVVATLLANNNISANVIAATYHDHVFVGIADADKALRLLQTL